MASSRRARRKNTAASGRRCRACITSARASRVLPIPGAPSIRIARAVSASAQAASSSSSRPRSRSRPCRGGSPTSTAAMVTSAASSARSQPSPSGSRATRRAGIDRALVSSRRTEPGSSGNSSVSRSGSAPPSDPASSSARPAATDSRACRIHHPQPSRRAHHLGHLIAQRRRPLRPQQIRTWGERLDRQAVVVGQCAHCRAAPVLCLAPVDQHAHRGGDALARRHRLLPTSRWPHPPRIERHQQRGVHARLAVTQAVRRLPPLARQVAPLVLGGAGAQPGGHVTHARRQLAGAARALLAVLDQHLVDQAHQLQVDVVDPRLQPGHGRADDLGQHLLDVRAVERRLPGQAFVQHATEREDVRPPVDVRLGPRLLGRGVAGRADRRPRAGCSAADLPDAGPRRSR